MTNFELGVHIPLIIRVPWMVNAEGQESNVLAEMVDVFPTLAALAGLPDPKTMVGSTGINGTSLAPIFVNPANTSIKVAAFSQFSKNNIGIYVDPTFPRNATQLMGYSVRTAEWRYTAWFRFDGANARGPFRTGNEPDYFGKVMIGQSLGTELYDHRVRCAFFNHGFCCVRASSTGGAGCVRCAFFDGKLHSRVPLSFTPLLRLKHCHACGQWHSSRVFTSPTSSHCKLRPNTEGRQRQVVGLAW
jgi:hypothetical protein